MKPVRLFSALALGCGCALTVPAATPAPADLAAKLLGVDAAQQAVWKRAAKAGVLEVAPVHLPVNPPGDCNHYGWPVATMAGDALIVMHRRIPGHRAKGAGGPHPKMSSATSGVPAGLPARWSLLFCRTC